MQASCRRCVDDLRGAAGRLLRRETTTCVFVSGIGSLGVSTQYLSKRNLSSRSVDGFKIPTTDDWEEFVAQCRKAGQDAEPTARDAVQNSEPKGAPAEQASVTAMQFSIHQKLPSVPDALPDAVSAVKEADVWSGGPCELLPGKQHQESEDFSAPCLLYTSPSPRDRTRSRMPSSA